VASSIGNNDTAEADSLAYPGALTSGSTLVYRGGVMVVLCAVCGAHITSVQVARPAWQAQAHAAEAWAQMKLGGPDASA
jgi:hypothetical protein